MSTSFVGKALSLTHLDLLTPFKVGSENAMRLDGPPDRELFERKVCVTQRAIFSR